jgi:hypothetical protein
MLKKYVKSFSKENMEVYNKNYIDYNDYDAINVAKKYIEKFSNNRKMYHHNLSVERAKKYSFRYGIDVKNVTNI